MIIFLYFSNNTIELEQMGKTEKNPNRNTNDEKDILSTKQSQATKKTF